MSSIWSKYDICFLIENINMPKKELAIKLNRSITAINKKLNKEGYKGCTPSLFTSDEIKYMIDNCYEFTSSEIGKKLNRRQSVVYSKMINLGLKPISKHKTWTDEDYDFLNKNKNMPRAELAKKLGTTRANVQTKMTQKRIIASRTINTNINAQSEIFCQICKKTYPKTVEFFYFKRSDKTKLSGSTCKICERKNRILKSSTVEQKFKIILKGIRTNPRSGKYGGYDIDLNFLLDLYNKQGGKCAITGIDMAYVSLGTGRNPKSISIDRIDSTKGYFKKNIQLICDWANIAKARLTMNEFSEMIKLSYFNMNNNGN